MLSLLQDVPVWLSVLVAMGGAVVCGLNIGRSRWAAVLLGGFLAEAAAAVFSRLVLLGVRSGLITIGGVGVGLLVASIVGLVGRGAIVAGVAGILSDLSKSSNPSARSSKSALLR